MNEPFMWNEKVAIWSNGGYFIAVNSLEAPTYISLWTEDNIKVGCLSVAPTSRRGQAWLKVGSVFIERRHRGQGLAAQLYRQLLNHAPGNIAGLYSYLPDRTNKRQVPAIYQRLGGIVIDSDHAYITKQEFAYLLAA